MVIRTVCRLVFDAAKHSMTSKLDNSFLDWVADCFSQYSIAYRNVVRHLDKINFFHSSKFLNLKESVFF